MNIAVLGSGGREHAICASIKKSKNVNKIYCIPGNAGTANIAINLDIDILDFSKVYKVIKNNFIELVIVGPEEPLVNGIVDYLTKKNVKVFGPNKFAAKLEGSKAFMKLICKKKNIPTAGFKICKTKKEVSKFIKKNNLPIVVKADGLAAGKGVSICKKKSDVVKVSNEIFSGKFKSSRKVVLEEFLYGEEASYFLIVGKNSFISFGNAQDHKKVGENEKGLNTGGMGAYSPSLIINKEIEKKILKKIVVPTLKFFKEKRKPYTGILYAGLMIKNGEPFLIEYNVRMGDPECQVILPRLKSDFIKIIKKSLKGNLKNSDISWSKKKCMTIVLCSKGYPKKYKKNILLKKINKIKLINKNKIFHAGTKIKNNKVISIGGRVLSITSIGNNFLNIRREIIKIIKKIKWRESFFRRDIGWRVINK